MFVRLYNFDVAKHEAKREHEDWLREHVVAILRDGGSISIQGIASPSDTEAFNATLSQRRAERMLMLLRTFAGPGFHVANLLGRGEGAARDAGVADGKETDYWRGVIMLVVNRPTPSPPHKVPPLPSPPKTYVDRRVFGSFIATYKINDRGATAGDGNAAKFADAASAIMHERRLRAGNYPLSYEKREKRSTTAKVTFITVSANSVSTEFMIGGAEMNYCAVQYEWGETYPSQGPILLSHYHRRGAFQKQPAFAYRLTEAQADLWLQDPAKAFTELGSLPISQRVNSSTVIQEHLEHGAY